MPTWWSCRLIPLLSPLSLHILEIWWFSILQTYTPFPSSLQMLSFLPETLTFPQLSIVISSQEEFPDHSSLRYSAPMYFLYQDTWHTLFHNCQFIYPYFLLDYTHHEDSGCVSLIHPVSSATAQCLEQIGICLMNAAMGIPSTADRAYRERKGRRVRMRKEARK